MAITAGPFSRVLADVAIFFAHLLALLLTIFVLLWTIHFRGGLGINSHDANHIFNVHPVIMVLGFIIVIGEGNMVYMTADRQVRKTMHLILESVGLVLGTVGIVATFKFHKKTHTRHMMTLHSWFGMITICSFALLWLVSILIFVFPKASAPNRRRAAPIHATIGLAVFVISIGSAAIGLAEKEGQPGRETNIINFTGLCVVFFAIAVAASTILPRVLAL